MEVLRYLTLLALLLMASSLVIGATQRKQKPKLSLSDKVQNLLELSAKTPMLQFNGPTFREYVKKQPRNYSVVLLFTALAPTRDCPICWEFYEEFAILANSYLYSPHRTNGLFFGFVDYDQDPVVFHITNVNTAPTIMHFPAENSPKQADILTVFYKTFDAEAMAEFVAKRAGVQIPIVHPLNISAIAMVVGLVVLVGGFLYVCRNNLEFLYSKRLWGAVAVIFVLVMSSGYMYNHIRNTPFVKSTNGRTLYISRNNDEQLGFESFAVMCLYAVFALSLIMLTESTTQTEKRKAYAMTLMGLGMSYISFVVILSMLGTHSKRYPFSLFHL